jgi:cytochrome P450
MPDSPDALQSPHPPESVAPPGSVGSGDAEALGELYDPLGAHMDDPYPFYARARRATPIFFSPALDAWVVTRLADVRRVLRDGETFSSVNALRPFAPLDPEVDRILAGRQTTKETTVAGRRLPAGAEIAVWLAAANRDESAFERAEEFDITRPPRPNVVFGHGAHYCLGAGLARREVEVSLRVLTERLPGLRLVPDQRIEFRPTLDHRGPMSLRVTWT